jgi:hypothetical protein
MLTAKLLADLRTRMSSAAVIPFREVRFKTGAVPQLNKCHENVAAWVNENPRHKPVRGWLVVGDHLLNAHSVVAGLDGVLFDITPLQTPRQRFLPHLGSQSEFWELPAEIHLVQFPTETLTSA